MGRVVNLVPQEIFHLIDILSDILQCRSVRSLSFDRRIFDALLCVRTFLLSSLATASMSL